MTNPVRNHLQSAGFGSKTGDRMDVTSRHLVSEIRRVLGEYLRRDQQAETALRELDAIQAFASLESTVLGPDRLDGEPDAVSMWLPRKKD
jgi:hypothetical protein